MTNEGSVTFKMSSSSSCQCPPVSPCSCTLRTLASVSTSVAAAAQSGPSVTVKKNYSPRLTDDERRRIIDLFLCSQSYEQIQSSFGDKKINVRTIQSVVRTFQKQGRISSKHPTGSKRKYTGTRKILLARSLARLVRRSGVEMGKNNLNKCMQYFSLRSAYSGRQPI